MPAGTLLLQKIESVLINGLNASIFFNCTAISLVKLFLCNQRTLFNSIRIKAVKISYAYFYLWQQPNIAQLFKAWSCCVQILTNYCTWSWPTRVSINCEELTVYFLTKFYILQGKCSHLITLICMETIGTENV